MIFSPSVSPCCCCELLFFFPLPFRSDAKNLNNMLNKKKQLNPSIGGELQDLPN